MTALQELITSGRIVDLMIVFIVLEIIAVLAWRRLKGGAIPAVPLLVNIGAGGSLMLALRAELTGAGWQSVALFLLLALMFHVSDLALRWQRVRSNAV